MKTSTETTAYELLQTLAIWGLSRSDTVAILNIMVRVASGLTDDEFDGLRMGMKLKPPTPGGHGGDNGPQTQQ